jgi:ribosome modulation factor
MIYTAQCRATPSGDAAIDLARRRGWEAFINGRDRSANPYITEELRTEWWRGYDEAAARPHAVII